MKIIRQEEYSIAMEVHAQIHDLFVSCFADYPEDRTFFKQLPSFRYLAFEGKQLIGHMAVDHRVMNIDGTPCRILGVADLCVHPQHQSNRLGTQLLQQLEQLGRDNGIDFIVLMAKDYGVYENNGYQLVDNSCKWLLIQNFQTLGVAKRRLEGCLMYKALGDEKWGAGTIDFLGWIF
ncbi:MAG: GNAT family N-acetyltransferase [Bacteroidota bacterium]